MKTTDKDQFLKLIEELDELSDNICKDKDIVPGRFLPARNNLALRECLAVAYDDIKGRMYK